MQDRSARLFTGLGALVIVWIFVYWAWPVNEPPVTSAPLDAGPADPEHDQPEAGSSLPTPVFIHQGPAAPASPPTPRTPANNAGTTPDDATGAETGRVVVPPEFVDYVVQRGDMGWEAISKRVYGTRKHWRSVAGANPLKDPRGLRVGEVIRIPVDPGNVQGVVVGEPETTEPAPSATVEYTVLSGDTLSKIAESFYGSQRFVDFLYAANRDRLSSKHDLRLGQVLLIPPAPAEGVD